MKDVAAMASPAAAQEPTFPQLLLVQSAKLGSRVAMREKHRGIWRTWSWAEVAQDTRALASGLKTLGFSRGERLLVIGDNRPRLYWTMCAVQMLGGIPLPVSADTPPDALARVLQAHRVSFAVSDGHEQCDKLLDMRSIHGGLAHVFFDNLRGVRVATKGGPASLDELIARGKDTDSRTPAELDREISAGRATDVAAILPFPDVTLGSPARTWFETREVVQSHSQGIAAARAHLAAHGLGPQDELLAYLPLGSRADQHFSYALALTGGLGVSCPEAVDTVPNDIRELGPTLHVLPAWALAQLETMTLKRVKDANALTRFMFRSFVGDAASAAPPGGLLGWLGNLLFHAPLRDVLGLSRTKVLFVDGRETSDGASNFFRALGLRLVYVDDQPRGAAPGALDSGSASRSSTSSAVGAER